MKKILLIPALLLSPYAFALEEGQDMTTGVHGGGSNLFPHFNNQFSTNGGNSSRLIAKTALFYNGSKFVPLDSITYSFSNGRGGYTTADAPNVDEKVYFDESYTYKYDNLGGYYINDMHRSQSYTANNEVKMLTYQNWRATSMEWKDSARYVYDYTNGLMSESSLQLFIGGWTSHGAPSQMHYAGTRIVELNSQIYRIEFIYNAANQLQETIDQDWVNGSWSYNEKNSYTYDGNNLKSHVVEQFNVQSGQWGKVSSLEYMYDNNNNVISVVEKTWDGSSFVNTVKNEFTYDANNNKLTDILSEWNGSSFEMKTKENWEYNNIDQVTLITTQTWAGNSWAYTNMDQQFRFYYQYYFPASVNNATASAGQMNMYPIPAVDNLTISLMQDKIRDISFAIVDMKGSIVRSWNDLVSGNYQRTISVAELPAGSYMIKASSKDAAYTEHLIVAH